jgi:hypothetical protein
MFTPKIFLIKVNTRAPWEDRDHKYTYVNEVEIESNLWFQCEFQGGAQLFSLEEATRVCAWLNKTNKNYFEIDVRSIYMTTKQSKLNNYEEGLLHTN